MDLSVEVLPGLIISDPFMVAASHWTSNENALRALSLYSPGAVTLKTTSAHQGGDGKRLLSDRDKRRLQDSFGNNFATYTDGPRTLELLDVPTTNRLVQDAQRLLPNTKIGLSILFGEDYAALARALPTEKCSFVELNLKYEFRNVTLGKLEKTMDLVVENIGRFFESFSTLPKVVKLPRELALALSLVDLTPFCRFVAQHGGAVIVANSKKVIVPPSRSSENKINNVSELDSGVVVGEYLLLDTYEAIRTLSRQCHREGFELPIVASGGILDVGATVDVMAAGAVAVQLCTALDVRKPAILPVIRKQLEEVAGSAKSLGELIGSIRKDKHAWYGCARKALKLKIDAKREISLTLSKKSVIPIVAEAIEKECNGIQDPDFSRPAVLNKIDTLRFVYTKGNVTSFLMGKVFIQDWMKLPLEYDTTTQFCHDLQKREFVWDLGILPESVLKALESERKKQWADQLPIRISQVATSHLEVVGVSDRGLDGIERLYHFGGASARYAVGQVLAKHRVLTDDLGGPGLLPLLRCWVVTDGILAKPPLSRFYGLLCKKEVAEEWKSVWECKEPLWLVARNAYLQSAPGQLAANEVAWILADLRNRFRSEPSRWAMRARGEGLLEYCGRLLNGSVVG